MARRQKLGISIQRARIKLWLSLVVGLAMNALGQQESPKLQPPLGEIPPTFWEQHGTTVMVLVPASMLLLAMGIWLLLRPKPVVLPPPEVQTRTALEALSQMPEDGKVISRASQLLRRYVQAVFQLPPGEPTTTEFCKLIADRNDIGEKLAKALADFLRQCDEQKFARMDSPTPIGAAARALELVGQGETRRAELRQQGSAQSRQSAATASA